MSKQLAYVLAVSLLVAGCDDSPRQATETDEFNAYFYYPGSSASDPKEVSLGRVVGISACQRAARSFAESKQLTPRSGWSYICCRIANGSQCYDKYK
jgi:hypothetical protein